MRPLALPLPIALALAVASTVPAAGPADVPPATAASRNVRATLVSEVESIQPGRPFWIGLHLQMEPGWHVYWKQPGDSGLPPRLRWTLPPEFKAEDILFPYPARFVAGDIASYGYTGEVMLLVPIKAPASAPAGGSVQLTTNASWLECKEACIPAKAVLGLTLPVRAAAPRAAAAQVPLFQAARQRLPRPSPGWRFDAEADRIVLRAPATWKTPRSAQFFCAQDNVIRFAAAQRALTGRRGFSLELPRDPNGTVPATLQGVLIAFRGAEVEAIEIEARPRKETQ